MGKNLEITESLQKYIDNFTLKLNPLSTTSAWIIGCEYRNVYLHIPYRNHCKCNRDRQQMARCR